MKFDLVKDAGGLTLLLEKAGIVTPPVMDLAFCLDVSGSFDDEHRDGVTNDLLIRLVPWGMVFDPDKKLDVFTFSDGPEHAEYVGEVTPDTVEGYIEENIIDVVDGYGRGTDYSFVLEKMLEHFGWKESDTSEEDAEPKGFFGGLFGKKTQAPVVKTPAQKRRSIILFVTDGENSDKRRTEQVLAQSEARKDEVYFLFLGVSNQPSAFGFIHEMGDKFGNVGFVAIKDIRHFVNMSNEEINSMLLGEELLNWLKA